MDKQLEARLFKKHSSGMIKAIRYPVEIANKLYLFNIIDKSTLNRVQKSDDGANELITAVEAVISSQRPVLGKRSGMSNKFKEILEIFKEFSSLNCIVKSLEDEYHNILEQEIDSKEDSDGNAIEKQEIIDSSKKDSDSNSIETIPLKKYKANPIDEVFPVPPRINKEDYPRIQRLCTTPPILYSEAGELVKDVDVILVTATDAEFRAVMGQAKPIGTENAEYHTIKLEDYTTFYLATYGKNKVAIIKTDQGARETRRVLDKVQKTLQAQYVISVGICYGLKDSKIKLGDVIVSKSIVDTSDKRAQDGGVVIRQIEDKAGTLYDLFRMGEGFELPRGDGSEDFVDGSEDLVEIKPGVIVSESTLVADQKYKDQILKQTPHALGGEMEGAGIMELAGVNDFKWIVIKAVADWGDGNKEICRKWQPFASVAAASYVHFHLERNKLSDPTKHQSRGHQAVGINEPPQQTPDEKKANEIHQVIKDNFEKNKQEFANIFNNSKGAIAHLMAESKLIEISTGLVPTYEAVFDKFILTLSIQKNQTDIEHYCSRFLKVFKDVGGPSGALATMFQGEWVEEVEKKLSIKLNLN